MSDSKKLSIDEQIEIIQKVLSDPKFMDNDQLIKNGHKKKSKESKENESYE